MAQARLSGTIKPEGRICNAGTNHWFQCKMR
jgi:hypothetical protein